MPVVCGLCVRAFLPPGAAADEYLCTITHEPTELDAHSEPAALGRSRNTRRTRVLGCGVVIGVCTLCDASRSLPRERMPKKWCPCVSRRHPASSSSPAKDTLGAGVMPHLWPPTKADQERASAPADRTKVCSGCKTGAERDAKRARLSEPAPTTHPSALTTAVVSCAAQSLPVVLSGGPALQTLAVAPNLFRGLGDERSTHSEAATIGGNGKAPVPVVAREPDPQPPGVAVSGGKSVQVPQDQSWESAEPYLAALLARYDSLTAPELGSLDRLINRHFPSTRPPEISVAFENGVNRTYVWVSKNRGGAVGDRHLRR